MWLSAKFGPVPHLVAGCFPGWNEVLRTAIPPREDAQSKVRSSCQPLYVETKDGSSVPWLLTTTIEARERQLRLDGP